MSSLDPETLRNVMNLETECDRLRAENAELRRDVNFLRSILIDAKASFAAVNVVPIVKHIEAALDAVPYTDEQANRNTNAKFD